MKKFLLFSGLILFGVISSAQGQLRENVDTAKADATISSAAVYFGYGAELTHIAKVKVDAGTKIIVLNLLSTNADINSLQISVPEEVALLSQHYSVYYPPVPLLPKTREVEKLEDSILLVQKEISRINNLISIDQEILNKTGFLIETTFKTTGNKTVTSDEVVKLLEYYNTKIEKLKTTIYNQGQSILMQNKRIDELRKRIATITTLVPVKQKPYGQVFLQVMCKRAGEIPIDLSYYTPNAGWTALYDIRVNSKTNKVKMVYKASLTQTTGIDWKNTKLTLSTGTPNFGVSAPILTPWYLH